MPPEKLIAKLQQSQTEHAEAHDGLLRARAEVENVRRRSQNEIVAARKFAIEGFARELLGVRDSLERAASVALDEGASEPVGQMKEGLGLTLKQFDLALARFAVVEVEAAPGTRFDPECHQAISTAASDEFEADHIVSVVQKGFLLKERLLRPAMVIVAQKA
ncbi:MAG: nucleotide exchange factor GrpE [Gammaproteobacteria bacterium]